MEVQRQLEYYFSDLNFPRDRFMRAEAANDPLGEETVAISVLLTFKKLVALGADAGALREAARASPLLVLREAEPRAAAAEEATAAGEASAANDVAEITATSHADVQAIWLQNHVCITPRRPVARTRRNAHVLSH